MRTLHAIRCAVGALMLVLATGGHAAGDAPAWFDGARPGALAREAVALLADAASHGLEPRDYRADALRQAVLQAEQGSAPEAALRARLERQLAAALQRYLSDLHRGRVDPATLRAAYAAPHGDGFDAAALLQRSLARERLADAVRAAAPQLPQYEHLREALARYRALGGDPAWQQALPPLPPAARGQRPKLEPGQPYAGLALVAQRLAALGDLVAPLPSAPAVYEGPLVEAVQAFQRRHGLADDGVIGAATLAQLQVSPLARVRQIELALERLRFTPFARAPRMIVINVPEFVLRAYEVGGDGRIAVRQSMKVIVGKALDTRTPLIDAEMRFVEINPYWNVPPSIARHELVPQLRRDPGVWEREGYEFVAPDGRVQTALSDAGLDAVLARALRIRQRPGPRNALGGIKFVFPNHENIYLHDTPAQRLFARERRDFSHGCIRLEQPFALARFVLHDMPQWSEARIRQAIGAGESATLALTDPVRVLIAYGTALVKDGRIHFFDDIYRHDRALDAALRRVTAEREGTQEPAP